MFHCVFFSKSSDPGNTECNGSSKRKLSLPYMLEASPLLDLRGRAGIERSIDIHMTIIIYKGMDLLQVKIAKFGRPFW